MCGDIPLSHFYSIVVAPDSYQGPPRMVGKRPTAEEWQAELCDIYGIHSDTCGHGIYGKEQTHDGK